ncbi:MAG: protease complex subunit PrcB family protein [Acidobacteriota bacterium]
MKHFANMAAAQAISTGSYCAKAGAGLKSLDSLFRALTILLCLALSLTPTLAEADTICFLTVLKTSSSGHAEAQNYVINHNADWRSLWEKVVSNRSEKPPLPEIEFTRRTIVAVFQGTQATSGYEISVQEIVETENSLEVAVKAIAPGKRCVVTGIVTRPFDIIEIEKTEKQVVFHVKNKVRNCG